MCVVVSLERDPAAAPTSTSAKPRPSFVDIDSLDVNASSANKAHPAVVNMRVGGHICRARSAAGSAPIAAGDRFVLRLSLTCFASMSHPTFTLPITFVITTSCPATQSPAMIQPTPSMPAFQH
uniref:Uncharacterized protein n=1 Tax=Panagrellus redivivus TaxID=6233 RepID=A0A7E4V1T3_PANRE